MLQPLAKQIILFEIIGGSNSFERNGWGGGGGGGGNSVPFSSPPPSSGNSSFGSGGGGGGGASGGSKNSTQVTIPKEVNFLQYKQFYFFFIFQL